MLAAAPPSPNPAARPRPAGTPARWRFGPLAVTPKVELKNLGWDSNVFNETEDPKSDFTTTVGAPIDWWLRFGRGRLHGVDYFEGVYFATYGEPERLQPAPRTDAPRAPQPHPAVRRRLVPQHQRPAGLRDRRARPPHRDRASTPASSSASRSRIDLDVSGRQTTYRYEEDESAGTPYSDDARTAAPRTTAPRPGTASRR